MSNVLNLTDSRIKVGDEYINKVYHKGSLVYNYEIKKVQVGEPTIIEPTIVNRTSSSIYEWESYTVHGQRGKSRTVQDAHFINNKQIGSGFNSRVEVESVAKSSTFYKGTKGSANHNKIEPTRVYHLDPDSTYATRIRVNLPSGVSSPNGSNTRLAFRVTDSGGSTSALSGDFRYNQLETTYITTGNFTTSVSSSNLDIDGNPLHIILKHYTNNHGSPYGDHIIVNFTQKITGIHDVKLFYSLPIYYEVVSGDSWWAIWNRERIDSSTTIDDIYRWNDADASTPIYPGQKKIVGFY